jgi:hypothetical protein
MELGGNLPESLIEHTMLPPPEASDAHVDNTVTNDEDVSASNESEPFEPDHLEDEDDDDEEPLKAEGR